MRARLSLGARQPRQAGQQVVERDLLALLVPRGVSLVHDAQHGLPVDREAALRPLQRAAAAEQPEGRVEQRGRAEEDEGACARVDEGWEGRRRGGGEEEGSGEGEERGKGGAPAAIVRLAWPLYGEAEPMPMQTR